MALTATQKDADGVVFVFRALGYPHLRARAVGDHLLIEAGPLDAPRCGIRLRRTSADDWRVEMLFDSRWKKTPNVGPRGNMAAAICDLFGRYERGEL